MANKSFVFTEPRGIGTIPPSGKRFELQEYQFWRVREGKIVERSVCFDTLGMLFQSGAFDPA